MEELKKLFRRETCLPSLGPCFVIFAIPLLVPGLTLTLVVLWDETGYSKFSALHVLGIILLIASCVMFVLGLVLHCTVSQKAKRRISPEDDEEGDILSRSSSSSCLGSKVMGRVHSTHGTRSTEQQAPSADSKEPSHIAKDLLTGLPAMPEHRWKEPRPASVEPDPASPRKDPIHGKLPAIAMAPAASRTLQVHDSRVLGNQRRGTCNYMLTDSEDERMESVQYQRTADAELMRKNNENNNIMKTMSTISSSSRFSTEHSTGETSDVEHDHTVLGDDRRETSEPAEGELRTERSVFRARNADIGVMSYTSMDQSVASSSFVEDAQTNEMFNVRQRETPNPNEEDVKEYGSPLFVTRQKTTGETLKESDAENFSESQTATHQPGPLQENSASSSPLTESPSQGTYSVKSFASEEPAVKLSPDELSVTEDDVFRSYPAVQAASLAERCLSASPVPLRKTTATSNEDPDRSYTVMGSKSGDSTQSSPEKHPHTGNHHSRAEEDGAERRKKRKKKKKKKSRDRLKAERDDQGGLGMGEVGVERTEDQGDRFGRPRPALSRSVKNPPPPDHIEHHVHWPDADDDDDVSLPRVETDQY